MGMEEFYKGDSSLLINWRVGGFNRVVEVGGAKHEWSEIKLKEMSKRLR